MTRSHSRYEAVTRRAFLRRMGATAGAAALLPLVAACTDDADVFAGSTGTVPTTTTVPPTTVPPSTTAAPTTVTTDPGTLFPENGELQVQFTYEPLTDESGRVIRDPYVAVWVEDEAGELVTTIALWFEQGRRGGRWLPDLVRWNAVDGSNRTVELLSAASRDPGDYTVVWDGTDIDGTVVPAGEYFIAIEASREDGPYSLVHEPVTIGSDGFLRVLPDNSEIINVTILLVA